VGELGALEVAEVIVSHADDPSGGRGR